MRRWSSAALVAAVALAGCAPRATFLGATLPAPCRPILGGAREGDRCAGWAFDRIGVVAADDGYDAPALHRYIAGVAARVARANRLPPPVVRVVDRGRSRAFAHPGGYIYVSRTALPILDNEAELAALLAHELAHVASGHTSDLRDPFQLAAEAELREARSRDDEAVADERAVEYLAAAGYAPSAMRTALAALDRDVVDPAAVGAGAEADAISGAAIAPAHDAARLDARHRFRRALDRDDLLHPPTPERLARVTRMIDGRTGGELGAARYRAAIAGVIIDADPRRGMMTSPGTWSIARLGLAIDLPHEATESNGEPSDASNSATTAPVGRAWGDAVAATLLHRRRTTVAGHPTVIGVAPGPDASSGLDPAVQLGASIDAPTPGAHDAVAIITVGERALAVYLRGERAEARLPLFLAGVRAIMASERTASTPARLVYVAAPAAGTVEELVPRLCGLPDESRRLDDPSRPVAAGTLVKCAERAER